MGDYSEKPTEAVYLGGFMLKKRIAAI